MTLLDLVIILWNLVYHLFLWVWPAVAVICVLYLFGSFIREREAALRKIIREELRGRDCH